MRSAIWSLKHSAVLFVTAVFSATGCGGGGGGSELIPTDSSSPGSITLISGTPQTTARQDVPWETFPTLAASGLSYSISGAPAWATFDYNTGRISGTPNIPGSYSGITITAQKDGYSQSIGPFTLTVLGDPLKTHAWHLNNTGQTAFSQSGGTATADVAMSQTVAEKVAGRGILVAVSDSGTEIGHEDLSGRVISGWSRNYNLSSPWIGNPTPTDFSNPSVAHGTAVAGLIAASGWNGQGSRGVAPEASFAGFLFIGATQTTAKLVDQANGLFDIFNYSYGNQSCWFTPIYPSYQSQLEWGVKNLRSGKGALYIKSSGNEYIGDLGNCVNTRAGDPYLGNANLDGENSLPQIIIVGALDANSASTSYSSPGANVWISAPAGEDGTNSPAMITTDISGCSRGFSRTSNTANSFEQGGTLNSNCNYTSTMNGTSSAAPVTSGVVALMLSANPNLTWRDVKYILARTAVRVQPSSGSISHVLGLDLAGHTYEQGWVRNSAGIYFHNWYGFGRVNTDSAVAMARTNSLALGNYVETVDPITSDWIYNSGTISNAIPDNSAAGTSSVISVRHNLQIESVQVSVSLTHAKSSDIGVELTSPSGTKSILMNINSFNLETNLADARLLSNAFLDEMSGGNWTLKVIDGRLGNTGTLTNWKIKINGHISATRPDVTAPNPVATVTHSSVYGSLSTSPPISWSTSSSPDIRRYEYSIGTSAGSTNILGWRSAGASTGATATGLALTSGQRYYVNVRAVDNWENVSTVTSSIGWTISFSAPAAPILSSHSNNAVIYGSSLTVTGTCQADSTVSVTPGIGLSLVSATCSSSGLLTVVFNVSGVTGVRTFSVSLINQAGNVSAVTSRSILYMDESKNILAIGDYHVCAVSSAGSAFCWGENKKGQLGIGSTTDQTQPAAVSTLGAGVASIAAGAAHTCALLNGGSVKCWGDNTYGQLGNGSTVMSTTPINVIGISTAIAVVTGSDSSCALLSDQTVRCWGYNGLEGVLGNRTSDHASLPVMVTGLTGITHLAAARGQHVCALSSSGAVYCWGANSFGQLGNGTSFATGGGPYSGVSGISNGAVGIYASAFGSCAKLTSGAIKCWGLNAYGQIGNGAMTNATTPVTLNVLTGIRQLDLGDWHSCAVNNNSGVNCWGLNSYGVIGNSHHDGTYLSASSVHGSSQDVALVRSGATSTCALLVSGEVHCWGKLSSFSFISPSTQKRPVTSLSAGVASVSAGGYHTCATLASGAVKCWGSAISGQLGDGFYANGRMSGFDEPQSTSISSVSSISSGVWHTCSVSTSGEIKCWGYNRYGQLGIGTNTDVAIPTSVSGISDGTAVQVVSGQVHTCALTSTGAVYCWGRNDKAQLGDVVTSNVDTNTPRITISAGSGVTQIAAGLSHTCARFSSGQVKCWGDGTSGALGNCMTVAHIRGPTTVGGTNGCASPLGGVSKITAGYFHTCALMSSGEVRCWGANSYGQLGDGSGYADRGWPLQVNGITSGIAEVQAGGWHTCARSTSGAVKCWGDSEYGQIGALSPGSVSNWFVDVPGLPFVTGISMGKEHSCAVTSGGGLYCWGRNFDGELGDSTAAKVGVSAGWGFGSFRLF